jgi:hypothetical protein
MTLANIPVGLDRTESACPQLPADVADGFALRRVFGKLHQQAIRKLVAGFVTVDVGRDHFDRAGLVKRLHEFRGVLLAFESSERPRGRVAGFLRQPFPRFTLIVFLQERIHKDAVNVKWLHAVFAGQPGGLAAKPRQHFAVCRRRVIRFSADGQPVEVKSFRKQRAVAQPDSISSTEVTANGRDFDLEFAVVMPASLDARAVDQPVFAKAAPRFIPMAADTVEQSVLVRFFRGAHAVPVPVEDNPVPATISQGRSLTELSVSIKRFLNDYAHDSHIRFYDTPSLPSSLNARRSEKPARGCSPRAGYGRGANLTRPHERHGKVPLREARQAAPDGARASAALSSSKILPFSRGTWPLRRKDYGFAVISYIAANLIAEGICNKSRLRLQPSREGLQRKIQMRTRAVEPTSRRPATIPRDENLEANSRWFSSLIRRQAEWPAQPIAVLQKAASAEKPHERTERQPENRHNASAQDG